MSIENLPEFKMVAKDKNPNLQISEYEDLDLLKWLEARDNDVEAAVNQFLKHLEFRREHKLDQGFLENYQSPEVLQRYWPGGLYGTSKEGYIVKYEMPGKLDVKGLMMSSTNEEFKLHAIHMAETMLKVAKEKAREADKPIDKWIIVIDAEDFGLKQLSKSINDRQIAITKMFEENYPDRLVKTYIVNCSKFFKVLLKMMKVAMDPTTFSKIVVLDNKIELLNVIDAEQLPAKYGGRVLEDGLCPGGEVPKTFYQTERLLTSTESWPRREVKAGTEFSVTIEVKEGGKHYLCYEFYTLKNRITFTLLYKETPESTKTETLRDGYKAECWLCPESGVP